MKTSDLSQKLLVWYDVAGRDLPWRHKGGAHPDPYVVLVSEIMLQQTTVKTVIPFFARFMQRFPTVEDLAAAPVEEVYQYWQGLGYYSRARSLHAAAQTIAGEYGSRFPGQAGPEGGPPPPARYGLSFHSPRERICAPWAHYPALPVLFPVYPFFPKFYLLLVAPRSTFG